MHNMVFMQILDSRAHIVEISANQVLAELSEALFDLAVQCTIGRILKNHVRGIVLCVVVIVQQTYDVAMMEFVMYFDLLFGIAVDNLHDVGGILFLWRLFSWSAGCGQVLHHRMN